MTKHILVPTDGSKLSLKAAKEAAALARALKARVTAVYVAEPFLPPLMMEEQIASTALDEYQDAHLAMTKRASEAALKKVQMALAAGRVKCDAVAATASLPWEGILEVAKKRKCDMIVMASHGRGAIAGVLLGSVTARILSGSKIPVLVCR